MSYQLVGPRGRVLKPGDLLSDQGYERVVVGNPVGDPRKNTLNVTIETMGASSSITPDPVPGEWFDLCRLNAGVYTNAGDSTLFNTGYDTKFVGGPVGTKLTDNTPGWPDQAVATANTMRIFPGTNQTFNLYFTSGFGALGYQDPDDYAQVRLIVEVWEANVLDLPRPPDVVIYDQIATGDTWLQWDLGTGNTLMFDGFDYRVERYRAPYTPPPVVVERPGGTRNEVVRAKQYRCKWIRK